MRCSEISILLATRRDLSVAQEQAVRAHLDDCGSCAAQWSREERTSRVLRALPLPPVEQPPVWVEEEIQTMLQRKLSPRRRWRYGLAVAGVALTALVLFLLLPGTASTSTAPRFSPLDGTYQPGSLSASQDDPQITPTTDGQTPWNFYIYSEEYIPSERYIQVVDPVDGGIRSYPPPDQDNYTAITDPDSGAELLLLEDVDDVLLSPDGTRLYATVPSYVLALDPQTKETLWRVELDHDNDIYGEAPFNGPSQLATSPDGRLLYVSIDSVTGRMNYTLRIIDTQTAQLLPQQIITPEKHVDGNCPIPEMLTPSVGESIYLVCSTGLYRASIASNRLEKITASDIIIDAILSPDRRKLYVMNNSRNFYILDPATNTIEREITFNNHREMLALERGWLALSGDGSRLAIGNIIDDNNSELIFLDTRTWQEVNRLHLNHYIPDYRLFLNMDGSRFYMPIHEPGSHPIFGLFNTMVEFDSATGDMLNSYSIGKRNIKKIRRGP